MQPIDAVRQNGQDATDSSQKFGRRFGCASTVDRRGRKFVTILRIRPIDASRVICLENPRVRGSIPRLATKIK